MDEQTLKMLQRLKNSSEGKDFIDYLILLSKDNYTSWKLEGGDILRGKAIAFDQLTLLFDSIEEKVINLESKHNPEWM